MVKNYIPSKGDICWASLDPTLGHEQKGRRPVIVLSSQEYNKYSNLAIICPITSVIKGYPSEVKIIPKGVVLSDHIRSVDWHNRNLKFITKSSIDVVSEVLHKIKIILDL